MRNWESTGGITLRIPALAAVTLSVFLGTVPCSANEYIALSTRRDVAHDPQRNVLYIADGTNGRIARYDLASHGFLAPWNVGGQPIGLDIAPGAGQLAIADKSSVTTSEPLGGGSVRYTHTYGVGLVDLATANVQRVNVVTEEMQFGTSPPSEQAGVQSVSYADAGTLLFSSASLGTNSGTLRKFSNTSGLVSTISTAVGSNAKLDATSEGAQPSIGIAETSSSGGRFGIYDAPSGTLFRSVTATNLNNVRLPSGSTTFGTNDFNNDISVSPDALQVALQGNQTLQVFALDRSAAAPQYTRLASLEYQPGAPLNTHTAQGVTYSADGSRLYVSWDVRNAPDVVREYATSDFSLLASYPVDHALIDFGGLGGGKLRIAQDGSRLFVTVFGGVEVIAVPEPGGAAVLLGGVSAAALSVRRRRRRYRRTICRS